MCIVHYSYCIEEQGCDSHDAHRRYSEFLWLHLELSASFPGTVIPPIPEKKVFNKTSNKFVARRQRGLEEFLNRVMRSEKLSRPTFVQAFVREKDFGVVKSLRAAVATTAAPKGVAGSTSSSSSSTHRRVSWRLSSAHSKKKLKVSQFMKTWIMSEIVSEIVR